MTLDQRLIADGGVFTEVDPNSRLAATSASSAGCTGLANNETAYRYVAGTYNKNFYITGEVQITAGSVAGRFCTSWATTLGHFAGNAEEIGGDFVITGATTFNFNARERSGSTNYNGTAVTMSFSTPYYYTLGRYSALGAKGAVVFQAFSDSGRTTFIGFAFKEITHTDNNYTNFYDIQAYNYADANTVTGTNSNITEYTPAAGIDLTTATGGFVQTDPSAHIADYADCIVCTTLNTNEDAYHYKDYGASYFNGNYILQGVLNVTAFATGSGTMLTLLSLMNAITDGNGTEDKHCIALDYVSASTYTLKVREVSSATGYNSSASSTLNTNQPYWLKSWRDTSVGTYGTLYLAIYNDIAMQSQVGSTLSLALHDNGTPDVVAFQYFYPLQSWNTGSSRTTTFTIGGISTQNQVYNATKGAFSWAGTVATISEQPTSITATIGAFSWAGKSSPLSLMVQATKGAFSWAGKTVNLNTGGQVNTSPGAFSWAGKSSPLSLLIAASKGAFSWAGKTTLVGSTVTSLRTATLTKWDTATSKEIPDTGLTTVLYMLYDPINLKVFDFSDNTFKASASCVTPQGTMTERSLLNSVGTNLTPGVYDILLSTTGLSGLYQEYLFYYGATNHFDSNPVRFQDGIEYLGGLTVAENTTLNAVPTAAVNADAVWDEVLTKNTHNIANSAGKIVRQLRGMTIHEGTAQAGGLNTVTLDTGASATDHIYKECLIVIVAGTAAGEAHHILSYNGTTKLATVDQNWYVQPDNTSDFIMFGSSAHDTVETGLAQAATTTSITLNGTASTTDDLYNDQMIFISSGTGTGQVRRIADYVGATKVATVDKTWIVTPDSTSGYMLYPAVVFAADVKKMNAATVTGNGTSGDLWRGA